MCVYFMTGTLEGSNESGFMETPQAIQWYKTEILSNILILIWGKLGGTSTNPMFLL